VRLHSSLTLFFQMSDFDSETELAKRHDALKAQQDMEKVQDVTIPNPRLRSCMGD
jgi:hypothetical protein